MIRYRLILKLGATLTICAGCASLVLAGVNVNGRHSLDLKQHLTSLGIIVGRSTLTDVVRTLGPAEIRRENPKTTESPLVVCYLFRDAGSATENLGAITFTSGSAGAWRVVNVIRVDSATTFHDGDGCGMLPARFKVATSGGLHLGMSRSAVRKLLGSPAKETDVTLIYHNAKRIDGIDQVIGITVYLSREHVIAFEVFETETT